MKYKLILAIILILELAVGWIFVNKYFILFNKKPITTKINSEFIINGELTKSKFKYFYSLKNNLVEKNIWLNKEITYNYNSDGLHETNDYSLEKQPNVFRIITLGDSFTFGQNVDTKNNWTELLENELNNNQLAFCENKKFEVINLGVFGYGIPYIVERYRISGQKYNPDLVIWLESGTGFTRNKELTEPIILACLEKENNNELNFYDKYRECWLQVEKQLIDEIGFAEYSKKINEHLKNFFELIDIKKVVFFGFEKQLNKEHSDALEKRQETFPNMDFRQNVPNIFDLKQIFSDNHPNEIGHQTIQKAILQSITKDISNNCQKNTI